MCCGCFCCNMRGCWIVGGGCEHIDGSWADEVKLGTVSGTNNIEQPVTDWRLLSITDGSDADDSKGVCLDGGVVEVVAAGTQWHVSDLGRLWLVGGGTVYGTEFERACDVKESFVDLGAHTAQGRSPTKRSPKGLASGCAWEDIFNRFLTDYGKFTIFYFQFCFCYWILGTVECQFTIHNS